jgi:hypothetical protein
MEPHGSIYSFTIALFKSSLFLEYIPIKVKWTEFPSKDDIKHLILFKEEYPNTEKCDVICRASRKIKLAGNVKSQRGQVSKSVINIRRDLFVNDRF